MDFKTLYKKNANKKISQWKIYVDKNTYWSEFGIVGGKMTSSKKSYAQGKNKGKKNETSDDEQAIKEAMSLWNLKIKSENFVDDISKVEDIAFNPPMLANRYHGIYKDEMKFVSPKLDGVRCNISIINNEIKAISRRNNEFYTVNHIIDELKNFFSKFPSVHLDGELYNHKLCEDFNRIVSLVKKENFTSQDKSDIIKYLKYNVYDMWDDNNPNMNFSERYNFIQKNLKDISFIELVPAYEISSHEEIRKYFEMFVQDGYEGAIIRLDKPYEHKRSNNLLKYKEFIDDEFEILDICKGKNDDIAEYAWVKLDDTKRNKASLSFTDEFCKKLISNKEEYIGKMATIRFFDKTPDGYLRFPTIKAIRDYE